MFGQKSSFSLLGSCFLASCIFSLASSSLLDKLPGVGAMSERSGLEDILYFGWFLNETSATSLQRYTKNIFKQIYDEIPEVRDYINEWDIQDDPLNYFVKPLDPSSGDLDPLFHITAKYCGGENCSTYYETFKNSLEKVFETNLIGFFFTKDTYGARVNLTSAQLELFDMDEEGDQDGGDPEDYIFSFMRSEANEYLGIQFVPQPINYHPSFSRAHITLGCARGVPAVQTGFDLLDVIDYEVNYLPHEDYWIENLGMLRIFQDENASQKSFVLYTEEKLVVDGTFEGYKTVNNGNKILSSSLIDILLILLFT